jgi:GNAT superfamily N-acetyltransferase
MREPFSPLPRPTAPGPGGLSARAAKPADARSLVALYGKALDESRATHRPELVDWVVQAILHDPLRGLFVLAETAEGGDPIGFAAFETSASAVHGWSARLACLYVSPPFRDAGAGAWLLDEALELARYFGLNHVVAAGVEQAALLEQAGFRGHSETVFEIDLPPLYDEGLNP